MRIKLIKDHKLGKAGDIVDVTPNVGFGLTDSGVGIISKDMTAKDTKVKDDRPKVPQVPKDI